jgi:hypothetical protein
MEQKEKNKKFNNSNNNGLLMLTSKEEKDIMIPSLLSPDKNYNKFSMETGQD